MGFAQGIQADVPVHEKMSITTLGPRNDLRMCVYVEGVGGAVVDDELQILTHTYQDPTRIFDALGST